MNIPPKSIRQRLVRNGADGAARLPPASESESSAGQRPFVRAAGAPALRRSSELADMENVSTESLPVLQAFQDFLESERKHARRQVLAVSSFFLMLFIIVTGAGAFFGYVYFEKMDTEIAFLHSELNLAKSSLTQETGDMLAGLAAKTDALTTRIANGDSLIMKATSDISNTVSNSLTERIADIEDIRAALATLRDENRTLRHDLGRMRTIEPVAVVSSTSESTPPASPFEEPDSPPATLREPAIPPQHNTLNPLEIAILAPGSNGTMKWRIPISE